MAPAPDSAKLNRFRAVLRVDELGYQADRAGPADTTPGSKRLSSRRRLRSAHDLAACRSIRAGRYLSRSRRRARRRWRLSKAKGIRIDPFASVLLNEINGFLVHGEVRRTEGSHLQKGPSPPRFFHEVLGDYLAVVLRCSGTSSSSGPRQSHPAAHEHQRFLLVPSIAGHTPPSLHPPDLSLLLLNSGAGDRGESSRRAWRACRATTGINLARQVGIRP